MSYLRTAAKTCLNSAQYICAWFKHVCPPVNCTKLNILFHKPFFALAFTFIGGLLDGYSPVPVLSFTSLLIIHILIVCLSFLNVWDWIFSVKTYCASTGCSYWSTVIFILRWIYAILHKARAWHCSITLNLIESLSPPENTHCPVDDLWSLMVWLH